MNELLQDRVPPQNIEAEQAVLGSIFLRCRCANRSDGICGT